jgi:hypothetical protein
MESIQNITLNSDIITEIAIPANTKSVSFQNNSPMATIYIGDAEVSADTAKHTISPYQILLLTDFGVSIFATATNPATLTVTEIQ